MTLDRRRFLKAGLLGLGGAGLCAMPSPAKNVIQPLSAGKAEPLGTARNLIFVFLNGGPSHVDTFDLKRGAWTPDELGPQRIGPLDWPAGIMPELAGMTNRFALLRSLSAAEAAHSRAVYHMVSAHRQSPDLAREIPHFMSMLAYKYADQRQPHHTLSSFLSLGPTVVQNGFLPIQNAPFTLRRDGTIRNLAPLWESEGDRFGLLNRLRGSGSADSSGDFLAQQQDAYSIMLDPKVSSLFGESLEQSQEIPAHPFITSCERAVKVLEADLGARFLQINLGDWDHHGNIYSENGGLFDLSRVLDAGLAHLLRELEVKPGVNGGSLLDETLVVALGEFGRTVRELNSIEGRDHHHFACPALFAGGGVVGGRIVGATDQWGEYVSDLGWSHGREMQPEDLVATIFSALGVDWTERFTATASGRPFEMVETNRIGVVHHIDALFV